MDEYAKVKAAEKLEAAVSNGFSLDELKARDNQLTGSYDRFFLDTVTADKNLLTIASRFSKDNDLRLNEYRMVALAKKEGRKVLTRLVRVEGAYIACLRLLYELEMRKNAGRVGSVEFRSYKDPATRTLKMECLIYVQNIIPD
jgi:hypothetical protein